MSTNSLRKGNNSNSFKNNNYNSFIYNNNIIVITLERIMTYLESITHFERVIIGLEIVTYL